MAAKVFILGRTGCGKSTAARQIIRLVQLRHWSAVRLNDYKILREMFLNELCQTSADHKKKKFLPSKYGGFDVQDFSVLDVALKVLEERIQGLHPGQKELVIIEFARADYNEAFKQISPDILKDAYYLFINANVDTCVQRVHDRVAYPRTEDDYFVSDKILRSYFNTQCMPSQIGERTVHFIDNRGSLREFVEEIYKFVDAILKQEEHKEQESQVLDHAFAL